MKLFFAPKEQWELIKPIWRILLATIVIQVIGGVAGILSEKYGHPFIDFWYGGVIATFPGFICGTIWHVFSPGDKIKNNRLAFFFIGAICLVLPIFGYFAPLDQLASQLGGRP